MMVVNININYCTCVKCFLFYLWLTFTAQEVRPGAPGPVVADEGCIGAVGGVDAVREAADTLLPQQPHEKLKADEGEHAETEDSQDHHVRQLPHRLDQSTDDGLQTYMEERRQCINCFVTHTQIN